MKINKIMIVSFLLLAIFTLGSVSAVSDDNIDSGILTDSGDLGVIADAPDEDLIDASQEDLLSSPNDDSELNSADNENLEVADSDIIAEEDQTNGKMHATELKDDDPASQSASFDDLFTVSLYPNETFYLRGNDEDFGSVDLYFDSSLTGSIKFIYNGEDKGTYNLADYQDKGNLYFDLWLTKIGENNCTFIFENETDTLEKSVFFNLDYRIWTFEPVYGGKVHWGQKELTVIIPDDAKGNLTVLIDGVEYELYSRIMEADHYITYFYINPSNLDFGSHNLTLNYSGDNKYPAREFNSTFDVVAYLEVPYCYQSPQDKILLKLPKDAKGSLIVKVYDDDGNLVKTATKAVSNGEASISFTKLYGFYEKIVAEGKAYTAKLVNGKASIKLDNYTAGKYYINIQFTETTDGKTQKYYWHRQFTIYKPVKFTPSTSAIYYGDGKYKVKLTNSSGKAIAGQYVSFKINGKTIAKVKTNKTGWAVFKIPTKYVPKTYKFTVSALGKTYNKKVTVKQVLTLKSVKVRKYAKKLVLTATLKKGKTALKSKQLTFKFNGKTYKAKTNKKGIAKVTIKKSVLKKLKIGKKVKYQVTYIKDTVKRTAKVKK